MKRVQLIRHATAQADLFVGKAGEITMDTSRKTLRVHDETTPGGSETARADLANVADATISAAGKMTSVQVSQLAQALIDIAAEIAARIADVGAEETRALAAEAVIAGNLSTETTNRINDVDAEEARALAAEALFVLASTYNAFVATKAAANGLASLGADSKVVQTALLADALATHTAAQLLARANHTGTQLLATISDITRSVADVNALVTLAGVEILSNKTLTSPVLNGNLSGTAFLNDPTLAANSAVAAPSQQSVKAYVDAVYKFVPVTPGTTADISNTATTAVNWTTANLSVLNGTGARAVVLRLYASHIGSAGVFAGQRVYIATSGQSGVPPVNNEAGRQLQCLTLGGVMEGVNDFIYNATETTIALDGNQDFQYAIERAGTFSAATVEMRVVGYYL